MNEIKNLEKSYSSKTTISLSKKRKDTYEYGFERIGMIRMRLRMYL